MEAVLESLRRRHPARAQRVRVHETGSPPPALDDVATVVFWLGDPLRTKYPTCYAEAVAIEREARRVGARVVDAPDALSDNVKSRQSSAWRAAGLATPVVERAEDLARLPETATGVGFPLVVRGDEEHWQEGLHVVRSEGELAALDPATLRFPAAVSPLWDVRAEWRELEPRGLLARFHHKKRAYVLGDRVMSEHLFLSEGPIVAARTCTFARFSRWPRASRWLARFFAGAGIREDDAYWRSPNANADVLRSAAHVLGLEYVALDYSDRPDGSVVLWEANPYPWLPSRSAVMLPRLRHAKERLAHFTDGIADFLADAVEPDGQDAASLGVAGTRGARP
jgi:hypothetical protein